MEEVTEPGPVRDAGLIAFSQAVEHYEMARALIAWAGASGHKDIVTPLQANLDQEKKARMKTLAAIVTIADMDQRHGHSTSVSGASAPRSSVEPGST
jgi:ferritin-like metal-binding protein YciE